MGAVRPAGPVPAILTSNACATVFSVDAIRSKAWETRLAGGSDACEPSGLTGSFGGGTARALAAASSGLTGLASGTSSRAPPGLPSHPCSDATTARTTLATAALSSLPAFRVCLLRRSNRASSRSAVASRNRLATARGNALEVFGLMKLAIWPDI
jgi:hypothetical protein